MLDATASRAAKEAGQQLAIEFATEWKDAVLLELRGWLAIHRARGHTTMTFEAFRHEARSQPASFKAWGALPAIACKAGLIAPRVHPDGSPVMRAAESVKTHGHFIRVWVLVDFFPMLAAGTEAPSSQDAAGAELANQPFAVARVGEVRHSHIGGRA